MEALSVIVALTLGGLVGVGISAIGLRAMLSLMPSKHRDQGAGAA